MIDFVKLRANDSAFARRLLTNDRLTFTDLLNKTGQKVGVVAKFHNLTFKTYPSGFVEVEGSLHKFWNDALNGAGSQNWNDFGRLDLYDTIHELTRLFGFNPEAVTVHNLEFGVNLTLPPHLNAEDVLRRLLTYKTHKFNEKSIDGRGYFIEAETTDFYLKAYDKGTQYDRPEPMLRFEEKAVRMKAINQPGKPHVVSTLADLMDAARLDQLGAMLLTTFDRCILAEPLDLDQLRPAERETALRAQDPNTWAILNRSQRNRLRNQYDRLTTRAVHPGTLLRPLLGRLIADKWHDLLSVNGDVLRRGASTLGKIHAGKCDVLRTGGVQRFTRSSIAVNCSVNAPPTHPNNSGKTVITSGGSSSSSSGLAASDNGRKTDSKSCSAEGPPAGVAAVSSALSKDQTNQCFPVETGVSRETSGSPEGEDLTKPYIHRPTASVLRADADLLAKVEQGRKRYAKGSKEDAPTRAAHNLRNDESNKRNNLARQLRRLMDRPCLFPIEEIIRLTPDQRAALSYWDGTPYEIDWPSKTSP